VLRVEVELEELEVGVVEGVVRKAVAWERMLVRR